MGSGLKKFVIFSSLLTVFLTTYDFLGNDKKKPESMVKTKSINEEAMKNQLELLEETTADKKTPKTEDVAKKAKLKKEDTMDVYQYNTLKGYKGLWRLEKKYLNTVSRIATEEEAEKHREKHAFEKSDLDTTFVLTNLSNKNIVTMTKRYNQINGEFIETEKDTFEAKTFMDKPMRDARGPFSALCLIKASQEIVADKKAEKERKAQQTALRVN